MITSLSANLSVAHEVRVTLQAALKGSSGSSAADSSRSSIAATGGNARGRGATYGASAGGAARGGSAVFVLEALLIYIEPAAAANLIRACAEEAAAAGYSHATLCFADRLPGVAGYGYEEARDALNELGFALDEETWLPKRGLAKHMGVACASFGSGDQ